MKTLEEIKKDIESCYSDATVTVEGTSLVVPKERWLEVAKFLRTHPEYSLDYLSSVTGVDYKEYLEVVYHLYSIEKKEGPLAVKVRTDRQKGLVPSVTPFWRSAEFQEREAYDLVGIHFEGHPDLRRILMWDEFQYHPMRKDYVQEDQDRPEKEF
ncbi:MAG: NADH-quinone oxidoreductase subunit C [Candidatus Omnitrophica bacterium]|nr:NADH-quinone oxidoreductase subunit C [Candidatus Omnitrophota bacterium]